MRNMLLPLAPLALCFCLVMPSPNAQVTAELQAAKAAVVHGVFPLTTFTDLQTTYSRDDIKAFFLSVNGQSLRSLIDAHLQLVEKAKGLYWCYSPPTPGNENVNMTAKLTGTPTIHNVKGAQVRAVTNVRLFEGTTPLKSKGTGDVFDNAFGFELATQDASDYHFLQFIWRKRTIQHPILTGMGGKTAMSAPINTSGGLYALSPGRSSRKLNVDVPPGATHPFYDGNGATRRNKVNLGMYDQPSAGMDEGEAAKYFRENPLIPDGSLLRDVAYFDTFLVLRWEILFHFEIKILSRWTRPADLQPHRYSLAADPGQYRVQTIRNQTPVTSLPADCKTALLARFPDFEYLTVL